MCKICFPHELNASFPPSPYILAGKVSYSKCEAARGFAWDAFWSLFWLQFLNFSQKQINDQDVNHQVWVSFVKKNDPVWWMSAEVESVGQTVWRAVGEVDAGLTRQCPQGDTFRATAAVKCPIAMGVGKLAIKVIISSHFFEFEIYFFPC